MADKRIPLIRITNCYPITGLPEKKFMDELVERGFLVEPVTRGSVRDKSATPKKKVRRRKKRVALTAERVREFRKAREEGKSYRRIGNIFGVSDGRAWQIINQGK
jgi:hypothetical protein